MFYLQVILSFILAGSLIALMTLLAERFGSKIGGLITNLPSNILITLIFISLAQGIGFVKEMTPAIPIGMMIDSIFLVAFILLLRYNLFLSIICSLGVWLALALLADQVHVVNLWINVAVYFGVTILAFPAVLFSAMVILAVNQGKAFARATGKIMILSASNIVIYALSVYFTYPSLGIVWGTIISFSMAFLWVALMRPVIGKFS